MYLVLLEELDRVRLLEGVEIGEGELADVRALFSAEEERCLGILDNLRRFLVQRTLGARVLRFAFNP